MIKLKQIIRDLLSYCAKLRPYMAHNKTAHHILKNKVDLILPKFPKG